MKSEIVSMPTNLCWSEFHNGAALRPKGTLITISLNYCFLPLATKAKKAFFTGSRVSKMTIFDEFGMRS